MSLEVSSGNDPPVYSLRLDQIIRLLFARILKRPTNSHYIPQSWSKDSDLWPDEIRHLVEEYTQERVYPWPRQISPFYEDIDKLEDIVSNLPLNTKAVARAYADAQILYAIKDLRIMNKSSFWSKILREEHKIYKTIFSQNSGRDFIENILIAGTLSEYLINRPDRAALLRTFYRCYIHSQKYEQNHNTFFLPIVVDEPIPLPSALSLILSMSIKENRAIEKYLSYLNKHNKYHLSIEEWTTLTQLVKQPDSMLFDKPSTETYENIDTALQISIPGYVITRKLAKGAYKNVWKVSELPINRPLVYKKIKSDTDLLFDEEDELSSHDEQNISSVGNVEKLVRNELEHLERLRHKRSIPVPQLHKILSNGWIEDYIEGENLEDKYVRLRKQYGPLSPQVIMAACIDFDALFGILSQLHGESILHRDIKLENFIQERNTQQMYVTDFGLSIKGAFGARLYAAPEVIRSEGEEYFQGSDVWSLGMAFYRAISGEFPFGNDKYEVVELLKDPNKTEEAARKAIKKFYDHPYSELQLVLLGTWEYDPCKRTKIDFIRQSLLHSHKLISEYKK